MTFLTLTVTTFLLLATPLIGQAPNSGPYLVSQVLTKAKLSGSISYSGRGECNSSNQLFPPMPTLAAPDNIEGTAIEVLQEMFSGDLKMRITQESNGIVRMSENDVPRDILDVRIHRLSFDVSDSTGAALGDPNMVIQKILSTREVVAFREAHNIAPLSDPYLLRSDPGTDGKRMSAVLEDVSVLQALDHIFSTSPGIWLYGNCPSEGDRQQRNVYFWFYENKLTR